MYSGAIIDTNYLNKIDILEEQAKFQKNNGEYLFINAVDREYRSTKAVQKLGQFVLQLFFQEVIGNLI